MKKILRGLRVFIERFGSFVVAPSMVFGMVGLARGWFDPVGRWIWVATLPVAGWVVINDLLEWSVNLAVKRLCRLDAEKAWKRVEDMQADLDRAVQSAMAEPPPRVRKRRSLKAPVCGGTADREIASSAHYSWHYSREQEPCFKAKAEGSWAAAERRAGHALPNWTPTKRLLRQEREANEKLPHICGGLDDYERPSGAHNAWHFSKGEDTCGKSRAEAAWYAAERLAGKPLPNWKPSQRQRTIDADYRAGKRRASPARKAQMKAAAAR